MGTPVENGRGAYKKHINVESTIMQRLDQTWIAKGLGFLIRLVCIEVNHQLAKVNFVALILCLSGRFQLQL